MDVLNILTERLKSNFNFLSSNGYIWMPQKIYNQNNADRIFATLTLKNNTINKELSFSISPRTKVEIDIYVTDCDLQQSMDLKHYVEFKEGLKPQYSPSYELDKEDLTGSTDRLSANIKILIEGDLKDVINGREWITFLTYDPTDEY